MAMNGGTSGKSEVLGAHKLAEALRYGLPLATLAAACAIAHYALPAIAQPHKARVVASALVFDFTVTVPGLVFLLLVRSKRLAWPVLVPTFLAGFVLAAATLPAQYRGVLEVVKTAALPAELLLMGYLVVLTRRAMADASGEPGDGATKFRAVARRVIGVRVAADVLTTEAMMIYYAFRSRKAGAGAEGGFTQHRESLYRNVLIGLSMAIVVETIALHALVRLWSGTAAYVLTALSLYALVWLVGDYRAILSRPIRITSESLAFRMGLRWEADIPIEAIADVEELAATGGIGSNEPAAPRDALKASLLGPPNVRVEFTEPVEFTGAYGRRKAVKELRLRVDEPGKLCASIRSARAETA